MKETFYFPHDTNATQDPKMMSLLSGCGLSGLAMYWIIIEILHQQDDGKITTEAFKNYIKLYSAFDSTRGEQVLNTIEQVLIMSGLLYEQDNFIFSERVLKNKIERKNISELRSQAGKKSAEVRANSTSVEQNRTHVEQGKERKGKEIKGKERKINNTSLISEGETPVYGNENINKILQAIKLKVKCEDFKESKQMQRNMGKHLFDLMERISPTEFSRRLDIILADSFKQKNAGSLGFLYREIKGFVEQNENISFIS